MASGRDTRVAVVGASGYAGTELLRLLAGHPELQVHRAVAATRAGTPVAPSLAGAYPTLRYDAVDPQALVDFDVVFLALPNGEAQHLVPALTGSAKVVVDLSADFRLKDPASYPTWYGAPHGAPGLLAEAVYGLPELTREELRGARLVAAAGCYPTAAAIALAPFRDLISGGVIVDAASGVSGAGSAPSERLQFGNVDGGFSAYGLISHRHTPEMEQVLGHEVLFTPHLAPMSRGLLATCYARPSSPLTTSDAMGRLHEAYDEEPFVVVTEEPPSTKATAGSNSAHVTACVDGRTGWLVVLSALDNLVKGAAGQAIQCANLALGLDEAEGLPRCGVFP